MKLLKKARKREEVVMKIFCILVFIIMTTGRLLFCQINVVENTNQLGRYEVYELTITHDDSLYSNVWEDVVVTSTFTTPSSNEMYIGGFYYDVDTWKVRVNAIEVGNWTWEMEFNTGSNVYSSSGNFDVVSSTNHGFIRKSQTNINRWEYDDGTHYYPVGMGDCIGVQLEWCIDSTCSLPIDVYFGAYSKVGFNIFRQSIDNCAYNLWSTISTSGNVYNVAESKAAENLAKALRRYGFAHWMCIFGFAAPYNDNYNDTGIMNAIKRYVKYCVDRYGAYVDFWEITNEANVNTEWLDIVVPYLKSIDPYSHSVATSWERPELSYIDYNSPHKYWWAGDQQLADDLSMFVDNEKSYGKPVIYGEYGNGGVHYNYEPRRFRIQLWASFHKEVGMAWWNTSFSKTYRPDGANNAYMGPEERSFMSIFHNLTNHFSLAMVEVIPVVSGFLKGFALADSTRYSAYIVNNRRWPSTISNEKITVNMSGSSNKAAWIDPKTGSLLGTQTFDSGTTDLTIPDFTQDIALFINTDSTPPEIASSDANQNTINIIFNEEIEKAGAVNPANFILESPVGNAVSLAGATFTYSYKKVSMAGLGLTPGNTYKVTVTNVRDINTNTIIDDGNSNTDTGTVNSGNSYTINGFITDNGGQPVSGIVIGVSGDYNGSYGYCITDSSGFYRFNGLKDGYNLVFPSNPDWTFNPEKSIYNNLTSDQTRDFTGTYIPDDFLFFINGYVRDTNSNPISGVTMGILGDIMITTTTDSNGYYEFKDVYQGYYRLHASKTGWSFTPEHIDFSHFYSDMPDQNFTGTKTALLSVDVTTLDFSEVEIGKEKKLTFKITNNGAETLTGTITSDSNWIEVNPTSFSLDVSSGSNSTTVDVTVDNKKLNKKEGQFTGKITITSNGGKAEVTVQFTATCVLSKPNPYDPTKGNLTFFGDGIVPGKTTIRIYTLRGELIKTLSGDSAKSRVFEGQEIQWNGTNEKGEEITNGIYIYVYDSTKEHGIGKFTVIK